MNDEKEAADKFVNESIRCSWDEKRIALELKLLLISHGKSCYERGYAKGLEEKRT